jgi:hypothetical protein
MLAKARVKDVEAAVGVLLSVLGVSSPAVRDWTWIAVRLAAQAH